MAEEESTQGRRKQRRGNKLDRRSDVWEHFILFTDDHGNEKAQCKRCSQVLNASQGTSSPKKHIKICPGQGAATGVSEPPPCDPPRLAESSHRQPIRRKEASRDLARMIAFHGYDPSVVEDDYFKSFVRRLNPGYEVPSRKAIEEMCSNIFEDSRRDKYRSNEDDPGKLSLAVGEAKTIETGQVVYVTTHFVDHHWNLHRLVEDVYMVLPVGDYYHVPLPPVRMVSLDNAVCRIMSDIEYLVVPSFGEYELFMVAREMTGHINHFELKDCMEQKLKEKIYSATYMDHMLHSIARCLLPDSNLAENIFCRINRLRYTVHENPTRLGLAKFGLLDDPWQYDERWYSCYCSLKILEQENPLESDDYTKKLLCTLWREIYRAIKRVSDSSRPTSNLCLQELFKLRDVLQSQLSKAPDAANAGSYSGFGDNSVADVLREALETVHKAIKDSYLVWSIPLVLDPRYKLRYIKDNFERAFGSEAEKYISEVRRKTKELYTSYIKDGDGDSGGIIEDMAVDRSSPQSEQAWDELDGYLQDSPARNGTEGFDILNWWKVHGSVQYPTVARMARDALAMPTCSKLTSDQMAHVKSMLRGYEGYL